MYKRFLVLFIFLAPALFFNLPKAQAAGETTVVINELMWMGSSKSSADEWIELKNTTAADIDFLVTPWSIYKNDSLMLVINSGVLKSDGYFLISNYGLSSSALDIAPDLVTTSVSLSNSGAKYQLYNSLDNSGDLVDVADDGVGDPAAGEYVADTKWFSMERNLTPGNGAQASNWHTASDSSGFKDGLTERGTPGEENSSDEPPPVLPPLVAPTDLAPTDNQVLHNKTVNFSWEDSNAGEIKYHFVLSQNEDPEVENIVDQEDLDKKEFTWTAPDWGKYYWQVISSDSEDEIASIVSSFELEQIIYSKNIIINEILPHPSSGADNEFIELYNSGEEIVDLSDWYLDDASGGSSPFKIPKETLITPGGYLVFYKTETKIALNDSGDSARLLFPDQIVTSSSNYGENASLDLAWAKGPDSKWSWTEKLTPNKINVIYLTPEDPKGGGDDEEEEAVNTKPIKTYTGDFRNFDRKLVKITGTVISTSGNTFYLDDGTGQAKIYIQDKTGIEKPPMHKGDIFEIIGIVDLYRNTWRILPRKQSDVKLISCTKPAKKIVTTSTKESADDSTDDTSKAIKTTVQARAPNIDLVQEVKAASTSSADLPSDKSVKNTWWLNIVKSLIGLAAIFMVLLVIKIKSRPRVKTIGGDFGNDDT